MASQDWFEKDFYAILGLSADADAKEIKKRYRKLARDLHPDAKPGDKGAEQRFKEIGEAYAVLSDPEQRQQYDAVRAMSRGGARFTAGGAGGSTGGFEDVFSNLFGGSAGQRAGQHYTTYGGRPGGGYAGGGYDAGGQGPDLEDLLSMFGQAGGVDPRFGGGGGFRRQQPTKGRDRQATATLSFRQAVSGDVVEVRGTDGVTSKVRIQPGVKDGDTIRIRGKGDPGPSGTPAGDLLLKVAVQGHEVFGREGANLTLDVPVTFAEAALGKTISVPTFGGPPVKVRLPAGTPSGRVLRVKGRGVATKNGTGDLLVTVQVVVPQRLSDEARKAVEVLAEQDAQVDPREEVFQRARQG
ncbi:MAG: DnaJ domain-containing protein [Austwickia sp.]|nr:DnaJ domain-containing protein [Austwickia sp.]